MLCISKLKADHERILVHTSVRALMFELFQIELWCERDSQLQKKSSRKTLFKTRNLSCSFSALACLLICHGHATYRTQLLAAQLCINADAQTHVTHMHAYALQPLASFAGIVLSTFPGASGAPAFG